MSKGITIKNEHQEIIELIKKADLESCDLNQLVTVLNLFDALEIPMKEELK